MEDDAQMAPPTPQPVSDPGAAESGDSFAAALELVRTLRESVHTADSGLGPSLRAIDADLAQAEAGLIDAEARFQRAAEQLTELVASVDTAVAKARAGLDRIKRRPR
jgi:hypothetical protein